MAPAQDGGSLHLYTTLIGIIGLLLSAIGYLINAWGQTIPVVIGMSLLVIGYSVLISYEISVISPQPKTLDHSPGPDKSGKSGGQSGAYGDYARTVGYLLIFLFFSGIHVNPALTITVRYYDKLAAFGALLCSVPTVLTTLVGDLFLLAYYVLGAIPKFYVREGTVDLLQMVSRPILAVFYALMIYSTIIGMQRKTASPSSMDKSKHV